MKKIFLISLISVFLLFSTSNFVVANTNSENLEIEENPEIERLNNKIEKIDRLKELISVFIVKNKQRGKSDIVSNLQVLTKEIEDIKEETRTKKKELEDKEKDKLRILSVKTTPNHNGVRIDWKTNKPTNSKVFLWKDNSSEKRVISSRTGLSLTHYVEINNLSPSVKKRGIRLDEKDKSITNYNFEIEAIDNSGNKYSKRSGSFNTEPYIITGQDLLKIRRGYDNCKLIDFKPTTKDKIKACQAYRKSKDIKNPPFPSPEIRLKSSSPTVEYDGTFSINWDAKYASDCTIDGPGIENSDVPISGTEVFNDGIRSSSTYSIHCTGKGGSSTDEIKVRVDPDTKPVEYKNLVPGVQNNNNDLYPGGNNDSYPSVYP